jgi:formylglycine-generating enzyme required for sulfatase activity
MAQERRWLLLILLSLLSYNCSLLPHGRKKPDLLPVEMVKVPGGSFLMGDYFQHRDSDALPVHTVTLPDFYISKYEITYAQYDRFAVLKGYPLPEDDDHGRGDRAVVNITWDEAVAFCECYGYRLPTEEEWEYAARNGGEKILFPGTNSFDDVNDFIRSADNSLDYSFYVGFKKPNTLGIYDMGGNAFEWIGAFYAKYPEEGTEPQWSNLDSTSLRIIRGGSFKTQVHYTFTRTATFRDFPSPMIGFRCVKPAKDSK